MTETLIIGAGPAGLTAADELAKLGVRSRLLDHAINTQQHGHDELRQRHSSVLATLEPLIERGQADGTFRVDVPAAWHLSMLMALIHAASGELSAGRLNDTDAGTALVATVLGAVTARHAAE